MDTQSRHATFGRWMGGAVLVAVFVAWARGETPPTNPERKMRLVPWSDPAPPPHPAMVELGRHLFFDPRLSKDNTVSCGSCHLPDKGFADGKPRGIGLSGEPLARNTPSVLNVRFLERFFWDGRATSLEQQALMPIAHPEEMNQDLETLPEELRTIARYRTGFRDVFAGPPTAERIAAALAAYQRTLTSRAAPVDRFLAGDAQALSELAQRGLELFENEAGCIRCHHGPALTDGEFYRLGVAFSDVGRMGVTGKEDDRYRFRTPPLREIAKTAPYMHDGSMETLFDVVEFYYRKVPRHGPGGEEIDVTALTDRSYSEIFALVAFLEALSSDIPETAPPSRLE